MVYEWYAGGGGGGTAVRHGKRSARARARVRRLGGWREGE